MTGDRTPAHLADMAGAVKHDRWVRAKVQTSRDDPRPAVADEEWQRIRAVKRAERKAA